MNEENIVEIKDLRKSFDKGKVTALNGIDLEIKKGEFVSITGPSGSGKSTLLNMIGALDRSDEGSVHVAGYDLTRKNDLSEFRSQEIGFIFQLHNLIPNLSVLENVEIPLFERNLSGKEMRERALKLLEYMGLSDKVNRKPTELSGGERQRVAIARALANEPSIILADEPTGSLDSKNGQLILEHLKELHEKEKVTLIMVTHDMNVASLANRTIEVLDGRIKT
ncbi:MAG: putative ABC transporter ATP-binding protein [Methanobacterium sp. PtaU1.Bin242]|jgi:putative ABC transport system ATP-binding protein|nr:MAG: putative ABC transporter ATP-binding protein [Methanobacterium sp. PtaU1.Bin242]